MIVKEKKGLSTLVSTLLILFVLVVSFSGFFTWYLYVSDKELIEYQTQLSQESVEFLKFNSSSLIVRVFPDEDILYDELKINSLTCSLSGTLDGASITEIDVSTCTGSLDQEMYDVAIIGNQGVFAQAIAFRSS